ncbi:abortive infection protein [Dietzia sp. NCCP-2495]|nr:abortive infection protein [Dietzia sp. NCCP-2495]
MWVTISFDVAPSRGIVARMSSLYPFRSVGPRARGVARVGAILGVLVAINLTANLAGLAHREWVIPLSVLALVTVVKLRGMHWSELGLSVRHMPRGLAYGVAATVAVAVVVTAGCLIPLTSPFFLSERYSDLRMAVFSALVLIPLMTVLPEEFAFRGVLQGALERTFGTRGVFVVGSVAFGLWHVTTSLGLTSGNAGLSDLLGTGLVGQLAGVALAVAATSVAGAAFIWVRRHSRSLLAPIGLHWAFNAVGALAAALTWRAVAG